MPECYASSLCFVASSLMRALRMFMMLPAALASEVCERRENRAGRTIAAKVGEPIVDVKVDASGGRWLPNIKHRPSAK